MVRAGVLIAAGVMVVALPARAELVVTISKADQRMSVTVDGSEMYRWPVSTGRGRYATPNGRFRPVRFERSWYSRKYDNAPMPYSIFFYKGYAVHGTTELKQLGRPASHGCVRLHPDNAATLFSLAAVNSRSTRIVVTSLRLDGSAAPAQSRPSPHLRTPRQRNDEPTARPQFVPRDRNNGFDAFGKAPPDKRDDAVTPVKETPLPAATSQVQGAATVTARVDTIPAAALRPGTHVVTMKVGSEAELRAVYRKYGFTW
ncbi:MAG: L,D-transpeptidase [Pseudolabrys sp.]